MRCCLMSMFVFLLSSFAVAGDKPVTKVPAPTGDEKIVSPDAELELLFTRSADIAGGLTEGAAVSPDGKIYFSDIPLAKDKGMILRFDPATKETSVFAEDSRKSNGLIFDSRGRLLAAEGADFGGRGLARWNVKTGKRKVLVNSYNGKKFNAPNDVCLNRKGQIYFTDPRYLGHESRELKHRAVYRVDPDGENLIEITHELTKPNGIAISPDQKTLYVANHDNGTDQIDPSKPAPDQGVMTIYAFPLDEEGKVAGPRRTLYDFKEEKGCDGMCVDVQGNLYLTVRSKRRPGVLVITPEGKELAHIPTGPPHQAKEAPPLGLPSNVEFGVGPEIKTLYITVDKSLYRIPLNVKGFHHQYQGKKKPKEQQ